MNAPAARAAVAGRIEQTARIADQVEAAIREMVPENELETILDNIGVPNSGINLSYSNAGTIGTFDGEILITNTFYSPKHFRDGKVPGTLIAKNLMLAYRWGIKTIYYSLLDKVGSKNILTTTTMVNSPVVEMADDEQHCEACTL
jgi:hypothetical protein